MGKNELIEKTYNFWDKYLIDLDDREELRLQIEEHINSGHIDYELECVRIEIESGWEEDAQEYKDLTELWNELNYYKTKIESEVK